MKVVVVVDGVKNLIEVSELSAVPTGIQVLEVIPDVFTLPTPPQLFTSEDVLVTIKNTETKEVFTVRGKYEGVPTDPIYEIIETKPTEK